MRKQFRRHERLTSDEIGRGLMVTVLSDPDGKPYAAYSPVLDASVEIYARGPGRWTIRSAELPLMIAAEDTPWHVEARNEILSRFGLEFDEKDGSAWQEVSEGELSQAVLTMMLATYACDAFRELMEIIIECRGGRNDGRESGQNVLDETE